jgi:hypothetical protein
MRKVEEEEEDKYAGKVIFAYTLIYTYLYSR